MAIEERYYTVAELVERFKVTRQTIYRWMNSGDLGYVLVGSERRVPESDLIAFIRRPELPRAGHSSDDNDSIENQIESLACAAA